MPKLIPASIWSELSLSIARGETTQVQRLVEENKLDVNAFIDSGSWMPLLMEALLSYGFDSEDDRLVLLRYLLDKGADPNIRCLRGYNCLHIAVGQEKYLKALDLFLDYNADVNIGDEDESNIVYWAIQGWLLRKNSAENQENRAAHLLVLEKILARGADLDQENHYGMCARKWLEAAAPDVRETVAKWEKDKPMVQRTTTIQPVFPVNLRYPEIAQRIWTELVPKNGPANTVQGELLRAVEKLRDDAKNIAVYNKHLKRQHKRLAQFIRDTLIDSKLFDRTENERIRTDTQRLMKAARPYTNDDIYDHLVDLVCMYYLSNPPRKQVRLTELIGI